MKRTLLSTFICLSGAALLTACGASDSSTHSSSNSTSPSQVTRGTIDGFGSVIVDGIHFESTNTEFDVNGRVGRQSDLHVGQVVTIIGTHDGVNGVALSIAYDVSVSGPVSAVDATAGTLVVLGQSVVTDSMTVFDSIDLATLTVGSAIEVSGLVDADGNIQASFVGVEDSANAELHGVISHLDASASTFFIGNQAVDYSSVSVLSLNVNDLIDGLSVEVEGYLVGGILAATKIKQEHHGYEHDADAKVTGLISSLDTAAGLFVLGTTQVSYSASTRYEHGTEADLALNGAVKVEGVVDAEGVIVASKIEFSAGVELEVEGSVEATDSAASTVTVMGVTALVDTRTRIRDDRDDVAMFNLNSIEAGDFVELRLTEESDGSYRVLRLERGDTTTEVKLNAPIESIDLAAGQVVLLGVTVDVSAISSVTLGLLQVGVQLEIKGSYDGSLFTATELEEDHQYDSHHEDEHDDSQEDEHEDSHEDGADELGSEIDD